MYVILDYFQFEYKPENANIKHEAEKAHAYVRGTAGNRYLESQGSKILKWCQE